MTGYGRGSAEREGWRAIAEIRSVNHRYTDLKLRGSPLDPAVEDRVAGAIRSRVERGAITVTIRVEASGAAGGFQVDLSAARRAYRELEGLALELRIPGPVSLDLVCAQPGVIVPVDNAGDPEVLAECVGAAVDDALSAMITMRETEGATLARDLGSRLDHLAELVEQLAARTSEAPADAQRRLQERLSRLLASGKVEVDPQRLAQEVAILADRQDVTEELVRLRSHVDQARKVIAKRDAVGRRLGFLVQELGREVNTVSSKSQSAEVASVVVEAKAELEKMREQVQNIE